MWTVQQLVEVAHQHGVDLTAHLPSLNGHAHDRGRASRIVTSCWVDRQHELVETRTRHRPLVPPLQADEKQALDYPPYATLRWCLAGDWHATLPLWWKLQEHAMAKILHKGRVRRDYAPGRPYIQRGDTPVWIGAEMARIVVLEHGPTASLFAAVPMLRCWLLGITPRQWNRDLPRTHAHLTETLERWYVKGLDQVRGWIAGDSLQTSARPAAQSR